MDTNVNVTTDTNTTESSNTSPNPAYPSYTPPSTSDEQTLKALAGLSQGEHDCDFENLIIVVGEFFTARRQLSELEAKFGLLLSPKAGLASQYSCESLQAEIIDLKHRYWDLYHEKHPAPFRVGGGRGEAQMGSQERRQAANTGGVAEHEDGDLTPRARPV